MGDYGLLTLLPAILVIGLAVKSKRTTEPLLVGCLVSYIIINGIRFVPAMTDAFWEVATDFDTVYLIIVCGLFGSLIKLLNHSKGTEAIANLLGKICKGKKSTLIVSWVLGIIIFIDDYMNIMTISSCMRKIADKNKVSRESLAYVIDSTGAPMCVLLPFSTWAIFYANAFYEQPEVQRLGYGSAMATYNQVIPFMFYASIAIIVVPLFILGVIPNLGAMKKAENRVDTTGMVYSEESIHLNKDEENFDNKTGAQIIDFLIPIGLMIVITLVTGEIFWAILGSIASCFILYIPRKRLSLKRFCDLWMEGFTEMVPALAIILAALFMRKASADINLPDYVVTHVMPFVNAKLFPAISFAVVSGLAFITGSNWGIPAVCVPILIPLAASSNANLILVMGAIISGGVLSSHACFYSDATVMTSSACGIENMDHVSTQIPYAVISFVFAFIAFLISGFII